MNAPTLAQMTDAVQRTRTTGQAHRYNAYGQVEVADPAYDPADTLTYFERKQDGGVKVYVNPARGGALDFAYIGTVYGG